MKMFLTRLGFHSKAVVTGDITQVDLPADRTSGLIQIRNILQNINGIEFVYFDDRDVVRHRLVQEIIKAYDRHGAAHDGKHPEELKSPPRSASSGIGSQHSIRSGRPTKGSWNKGQSH
jgi:phosphate starvation-inducible PhoH-like protein